MCLGAPERCHSPPRPVCEVQQYLGISGERDRGVRCVSLIDWKCDLAGLEIMVAPYLSPQDKILFFPGLLTRNFKLSCLKMLPIQDAEVCAGTSWLDRCQHFPACGSTDLKQDCMSCSVNYFRITSTKAQEEQLFQRALLVKTEVTAWSPGFLWRDNLLSLGPKKETSATWAFISLCSL